jgi:sigma-B regulation protein RsbU (phosphoserine phosphatase)
VVSRPDDPSGVVVRGDALRLSVARDLGAMEQGRLALRDHLESLAVGSKPLYRCELAFEELVSNAIRHGVPAVAGPGPVEVEVRVTAESVELVFEDGDAAFDPTTVPEPVRPDSIERASVGGLGVAMVRRFARRLDYAREDGRNRVTVAIARD